MPDASDSPRVGASAPELKLMKENGEWFSIAEAKGRPALISFLSHAA